MIEVINEKHVTHYTCKCSKCERILKFEAGDINFEILEDPFNETDCHGVKIIICPICQEHIILSIDGKSRNSFQPIENKKEEKTETVVINLNPHN